MTLNVLVCGFGALLLLVAIVGGGVEIKEFKVPKVGRVARLVSAVVGLVFILMGIGLGGESSPSRPPVDTVEANVLPTPPPRQQPVEFYIVDNLAENQVSEQVTILIDGKVKGQVTVDTHHPESMLTITVPEAGRYSYSISSSTVLQFEDGEGRFEGAGQGMIAVEPGKVFELLGSVSGNTWLVTLVERQVGSR